MDALLANTPVVSEGAVPKERKMQARSVERRQKILAVAKDLISEGSISALSLYDVAHAAQIPPSSLYHFFPKVEVLLQTLAQEVFDAFDECVARPINEPIQHWSDINRLMETRMQTYYQENSVARALILGQHLHVDVLSADHQHDEEMGKRIEAIYQRFFHLPQLPSAFNIFSIALQIADKVYAMSHQEFGNITPTMAQEGLRAARAYLALYLPEQLQDRVDE